MNIVKVRASTEYNVMVGKGLLADCGKLLREILPPCRTLVVTDNNVDMLYADRALKSLESNGYECYKYVIPHGEESKNQQNYFAILNYLAENKFHRNDLVVALGGGVVGDLAGFAASTYMRGIKFAQLPTTLLAGIDSSVGGKTAINLDAGKNMAGTFYQPEIVIFDLDTLSTLPKENRIDGMGEGVKYGILRGGELFDMVQSGVSDADIEKFCALCIETKRDIVQSDEREQHLRKLLNLGHTFAHAIEKMSNYAFSHGRAVGAGLFEIARISHKIGILPLEDYNKIDRALLKNELKMLTTFNKADLIKVIQSDKKADSEFVTFVVIEGVGKCKTKQVPLGELSEFVS